jgi:hypothetical protein
MPRWRGSIDCARRYPGDFSVAVATCFHAHDTLTYTVRAAASRGLRPGPALALARAIWHGLRANPRALGQEAVIAAVLEALVGAGVADVVPRGASSSLASGGRGTRPLG